MTSNVPSLNLNPLNVLQTLVLGSVKQLFAQNTAFLPMQKMEGNKGFQEKRQCFVKIGNNCFKCGHNIDPLTIFNKQFYLL
jgi:formamidopyrimidine-DNA glycosylase